jgi:hypothetical protein
MDRPLATVLTETLEAAETQLSAARRLDAELLADATANRQDLHFELELIAGHERPALDDEIMDIVHQLQETDNRLGRVLGAAQGVFRDVLQGDEPQTYGSSGRMRRV